jgi:hypothetical protein
MIKVWQAIIPEVKMFTPDFFRPVQVGKWYFSELDVCEPHGPYETKEDAEKELREYLKKKV